MSAIDKIDALINTLESLPEALTKFGEHLSEGSEVQKLVTDENRDQMYKGQRADGSQILPPYRLRTMTLKRRKGQPVDRVTLKDTGDFYNSLRTRRYGSKIEIQGEDWKTEDLQDKYGYGILGLSLIGLYKLRDFMRPRFIAESRRIFGL